LKNKKPYHHNLMIRKMKMKIWMKIKRA